MLPYLLRPAGRHGLRVCKATDEQPKRRVRQSQEDGQPPLRQALDAFRQDASQSMGDARWDIGLRQAGDVLGGKYTVQDVLGAGSSAVTYMAVTATGRQVAIKALSLRSLRDWKQLELFQREARALAGLSHPSIPSYIDYFEEDSERDRAFYIVQEAAQGRSLAQMCAAGQRPDEAEVRRIASQLLAVLQYLQELRPPVVHRDIKPENIVMEGGAWGGRVFLVDFGGVQGVSTAGSAAAQSSTVVGTFGFMAPEQFRGAALPASDLYALGGTLLFLLSGRPPASFPEERMRVAWRGTYLSPGPMWPALLDGLLEPVAEDRLTAQQALALLEGRPAFAQPPFDTPASSRGGGWVGGEASDKPFARKRRRAEALERTQEGLIRAPAPTSRPAGSRVILERSGNRLDITIPPKGFSGDTVATGAFAIAWNAFVAFWTVSALASGGVLFALFSAPFWFAGVSLAKEAVGGALVREHLAIGPRQFRLGRELAILSKSGKPDFLDGEKGGGGSRQRAVEGGMADLQGARVVTRVIVNGQPYTSIELVEGVTMHRFGEALQAVEQQWLVQEINSHLAALQGPLDLDALPRTEAPRIDNRRGDDDAWSVQAGLENELDKDGHFRR